MIMNPYFNRGCSRSGDFLNIMLQICNQTVPNAIDIKSCNAGKKQKTECCKNNRLFNGSVFFHIQLPPFY